MPKFIYTKEAAKRIGVHPNTLRRWTNDGVFRDVPRDVRGWRFYNEHMERLEEYVNTVTSSEEVKKHRYGK